MLALQVTRAERSEIPQVAAALADAFFDDPVASFAWPNDAKRLHREEIAFAGQMRKLWARREIYTTGDHSGAAIWARPEEWEIPLRSLVRMLPSTVRARIKPVMLAAYLRTDKLHPAEPHWYLEYLGTVRQQQGKGVAGAVLAPVLERADAEGIPVWTWSSNERNLSFYHRHGFEVLDKLPFAKDGPTIYPIRRDPRL